MARIIYSALVQSIQGTINGMTFQRNAYGHTLKAKDIGSRNFTPKQVARISQYAQMTGLWRSLTIAQREAWRQYASAFLEPCQNNKKSVLNGFNYFLRANAFNRLRVPTAVIANPSATQGTVTGFDFQVFDFFGDIQIGWGASVTGPNWFLHVYCTRQIGTGQSTVQETPVYLLSQQMTPQADFSISAAYFAAFGQILQIGSRFGIRFVIQKSDNGQIYEQPIQITTVL